MHPKVVRKTLGREAVLDCGKHYRFDSVLWNLNAAKRALQLLKSSIRIGSRKLRCYLDLAPITHIRMTPDNTVQESPHAIHWQICSAASRAAVARTV